MFCILTSQSGSPTNNDDVSRTLQECDSVTTTQLMLNSSTVLHCPVNHIVISLYYVYIGIVWFRFPKEAQHTHTHRCPRPPLSHPHPHPLARACTCTHINTQTQTSCLFRSNLTAESTEPRLPQGVLLSSRNMRLDSMTILIYLSPMPALLGAGVLQLSVFADCHICPS
jgi:hypothetical protein